MSLIDKIIYTAAGAMVVFGLTGIGFCLGGMYELAQQVANKEHLRDSLQTCMARADYANSVGDACISYLEKYSSELDRCERKLLVCASGSKL